MGLNEEWLLENPNTPRLYESGVRYRRERPRVEDWLMIPDLYARRFGDCEDLGAALAAERRVRDGCLDAVAFTRRTGRKTFHTLVDCDGRVEDPSRVLGMKKRG